MTNKRSPWQSSRFYSRLLLSYCLVPLVPGLYLMLSNHRVFALPLELWASSIVIYGIFGLAAVVVLGTPLLFLFIRLGWTGLFPFMAAGGACAAATSYAVLSGGHDLGMVYIFTKAGMVAGLLFRLILFGWKQNWEEDPALSENPQPDPRPTTKTLPAICLVLVVSAIAYCLYSIAEEHRTLVEPMTWQCISDDNRAGSNDPHVETIKLSFKKNAHYELLAYGPSLCADLRAQPNSAVAVTFEVHGNAIWGLRGYNPTKVSANGRNLQTLEFTPVTHGAQHQHPYGPGGQPGPGDQSPLEVFR
jgi:hypothetical protein